MTPRTCSSTYCSFSTPLPQQVSSTFLSTAVESPQSACSPLRSVWLVALRMVSSSEPFPVTTIRIFGQSVFNCAIVSKKSGDRFPMTAMSMPWVATISDTDIAITRNPRTRSMMERKPTTLRGGVLEQTDTNIWCFHRTRYGNSSANRNWTTFCLWIVQVGRDLAPMAVVRSGMLFRELDNAFEQFRGRSKPVCIGWS